MRIIYTPKNPQVDGDAQEWDFDPADVFGDEAELIEDHWGQPWDHFVMHVRSRSMKALRLLLWHLMRQGDIGRQRRYANLKDVPRFRTGEVQVVNGTAEIREQIQTIKDNPGQFGPGEQEKALAAGERELERALIREAADGTAPVNTPPEPVTAGDLAKVPDLPPTSEPSPTFGGTTG